MKNSSEEIKSDRLVLSDVSESSQINSYCKMVTEGLSQIN